MATNPINYDKELERSARADYDLGCALLTMLLRETSTPMVLSVSITAPEMYNLLFSR